MITGTGLGQWISQTSIVLGVVGCPVLLGALTRIALRKAFPRESVTRPKEMT